MRDDDGYYDNQDNHNPLLCIVDGIRRYCASVVKAARVAIRGKRKDAILDTLRKPELLAAVARARESTYKIYAIVRTATISGNSKELCDNTDALRDSEMPEQTRTVQEAGSIPERESEI